MQGFADMLMPTLRSVMNSKLNELLGILSLTEKPDNLLMWSHYTNSHEGFVVGFDSTHKYFDARRGPSDEFCHLRKVEYRDQRPQLPFSGLTGVEMFVVKSSHWAYEHEWRILRPLKDADEIVPAAPYCIHLFKFPPDAVKEVILGCRMRNSDRSAIVNTLLDSDHFKGVSVLEARPDESEFRIVFNELKL